MVDIAVDFSKREGYLLQPQKKCGNTDKTCTKSKTLEINDGYWKLDGKDMPIVTIIRTGRCTAIYIPDFTTQS
jgi:hypothetical protein